MQFEINAAKRDGQGSGASRRLRRAGRVPGIVYGADLAPVAIDIDHKELLLGLRNEAFHSSVLSLNLEGAKQSVLLKDVQVHPYKVQVLHVDFQRVDAGHKIHMKVPLHFVNAEVSPGVKLEGGVVSHVMAEIEVICLPGSLPEYVEVDCKELATGNSIHLSHIKLPAGVESVLVHRGEDPTVATILGAKAESADEGEAAAEGEAPAA
ncbi:50S ribosomal protein L25/general stress protein Ctc [Parasulfuritortus cantonensis]|uniref:Large ribosomal subunit protein bL25 n=1 Tax=Parasulfuritortus cantonensis TaxID=2528202 RepID=A0A4R1B7R7_9PROT|nr:50S ribosomal protein L25/general stress protein Ctc [Parasulfuritortus cantonensis]TCJ12385.1 50S ribosomal protein L25/general stress protein Ctc [Parasulfuritortus cantonensis]